MSSRRRAREVVLQLLFQRDLNPAIDSENEERFLRQRLKQKQTFIEFARTLLHGIELRQQAIDARLQETAENWNLTRMAVTDRSILRMGAFEIEFSDTPGRVAINEAIELAKRYGTNNSAQFVNGILDRLLNSVANPE